jgi:hypothetical protein
MHERFRGDLAALAAKFAVAAAGLAIGAFVGLVIALFSGLLPFQC